MSISKRLALKEAQNKLIQNLIKDANLNEDQANAILKDHLANMATIDKATDEDRARRVMALEMRLAERRALTRQKVRLSMGNHCFLISRNSEWGRKRGRVRLTERDVFWLERRSGKKHGKSSERGRSGGGETRGKEGMKLFQFRLG